MPILCTILGRTCRIPGCFNGSTEYVIHEAMPLLAKLDGVLIPSVLSYSLNVPAIPTAIYQKASKYVNAQDTRIRIFEGEGDGEYIYYFLSMSQTKCTKFTTALLGQYQSMLEETTRHFRAEEVDGDPGRFPCGVGPCLLRCALYCRHIFPYCRYYLIYSLRIVNIL